MSTTTTSSASGLEDKVQAALAGMQSVFPATATLTLAGASMTQAQIVAQLSGYLPTFQAVTTLKTSYAQAITAREKMQPICREFVEELRLGLTAFFKKGNPILGQFGMTAKIAAPQSTQTKLLAAAKRQVTKDKRGTLTKAAKAQLKSIGTPQVAVGAAGVQVTPSAADQAEAAASSTAAAVAAPIAVAAPTPASAPLAPVSPGASALIPALPTLTPLKV